MKKQKKIKVISSIFIFILGTIANIYSSTYLHNLLSNEKVDLDIFEIQASIQVIKNNLKALKLFGCFELLILLISLLFIFSEEKIYKSDLVQITPKIKIPVKAGQNQFGSARFMTDEEKEVFGVLYLKKDTEIKGLIKHGYDDIKNLKGGEKNRGTK